MTKEKVYKYLLLLVVFLNAIIQIWFVSNTIDIDTDSYAHFSIARQLIQSPSNLQMHWVWLPLFHYILVMIIKIGLGFSAVRYMNIIIWMIIPLISFQYISEKNSDQDILHKFLISALISIFPLGFTMAVTGQPEPLFLLLFICFVYSFEKNKYLIATIILSLLCLLRYESLAILGFVFVFVVYSFIKNKKTSLAQLLLFIIPSAVVFIWLFIRFESINNILNFFFETKAFVNSATMETSSFDKGFVNFLEDIIRYPILIPFYHINVLLIFLPFGVIKIFKEHKTLFWSSIFMMGFVIFSFINRSNLGLTRHFLAFVPLYSLLIIYGMVELLNKFKLKLLTKEFILVLIFLIVGGSSYAYWVKEDLKRSLDAFAEKKQVVNYLKSIPPQYKIFCDDSIIEVLSGFPASRFHIIWMKDDEYSNSYIYKTIEIEKTIYIVSDERNISFLKKYGSVKAIFSSETEGRKIYIIEARL